MRHFILIFVPFLLFDFLKCSLSWYHIFSCVKINFKVVGPSLSKSHNECISFHIRHSSCLINIAYDLHVLNGSKVQLRNCSMAKLIFIMRYVSRLLDNQKAFVQNNLRLVLNSTYL